MHYNTFQPFPAALSPVKPPATHFSAGTEQFPAGCAVTLRGAGCVMLPDPSPAG